MWKWKIFTLSLLFVIAEPACGKGGVPAITKRHLRSSDTGTTTPTIPQRIWFTHDIHEEANSQIKDNVEKTIQKYRHFWGNDKAPVNFLDDMACEMEIAVARPALLSHYRNEPSEAHRADLCRVAALYLHGGYYFDVDLDVVDVYNPKEATSFVTTLGCDGGCIHHAFLASTAQHPILKRTMNEILRIYEEGLEKDLLGAISMKIALSTVEDEIGETALMEEVTWNESDFPGQKDPGECIDVIHDPEDKHIYFYAKSLGGTGCDTVEQDVKNDENEDQDASEASDGMVVVVANQPKTGTGTIVSSIYQAWNCVDHGHVGPLVNGHQRILQFDCRGGRTYFQTHWSYDAKVMMEERDVEPGKCLVITSMRDPRTLLASWFSQHFKNTLCRGTHTHTVEQVIQMYRKFLRNFPRGLPLFEDTWALLEAFGATSLTDELKRQESNGGYSFLSNPPVDGPFGGCELLFLRVEDSEKWEDNISSALGTELSLHSTQTFHDCPPVVVERVQVTKDATLFKDDIAELTKVKPILAEVLSFYEGGSVEATIE